MLGLWRGCGGAFPRRARRATGGVQASRLGMGWVEKNVLAQPPGVGVAHVVDPALHAGVQFGERDLTGPVRVQIALQPAGEVHRVAPLEPAVRRIHHEAQPGDAARRRQHLRLCFVNRQPLARQASDDRVFPHPQLGLAVAEQGEIVHVAQVRAAAQLALDEPVEVVQIHVRPELRGQIADGQAARATGGEQVIARKVNHRVLVGERARTAGEDAVGQPAHVLVVDPAREFGAQDRVIQRRKVLDDVAAQHVAIAPRPTL